MSRRVPWHPVILAAVIVLTAWHDAGVSPFVAVRSLVLAIALALALMAVGSLLSRSVAAGALIATGAVGVLWSKQLITVAVTVGSRMGGLAILWGVLILAMLVVAARLLRRSASRMSRASATFALNRASLLLLIATVVIGLVSGRMAAVPGDLGQGSDLSGWRSTPDAAAAPAATDMYVILLDGYPRADVLDYAFGLDNLPFLRALGDRGFDVATASHSDYLWTHVSVPSALNLAYVEQIPAMADVIEGRLPRQPTLRTTIADNEAFDIVREHGYTPVAIGAGFEEVAPRLADVYVDGGQLNEFEVSLLTSTFAGDVLAAIAPDAASSQQRDRIAFNLDVLPTIAATRDRGPAFVFAHVPAPHQPVVFDEGGGAVTVPLSASFYADSPLERGEDREPYLARYRSQLPFLNQRILATVDGIVERSEAPPVIVLFADHGSASAVDWNATQPADADPARLLERTGTLFAALTPGRTNVFPDDISPVDMLRLLFDAYLGTDYGRAEPPAGGGQIAPINASVLEP